MDSIPWIAIAVVGLLILILGLFVFFYKNRNMAATPDYRAFFILGVIWMPLGFASENPAFWIIGLVFIAIGLVNRDKWGEEKTWADLSTPERNKRLILIGVLVFLVLLTLLIFVLPRFLS